MHSTLYPSPHVARWHRFLIALMIMLLCGTVISAMPHSRLEPRANPQLLQIAAERPATLVNVIIQKLTHDQSIETQVLDMGGAITRDLPIINGFVAHLHAGTLLQLAYDANIRWISPDAPVLKQSCTTQDCIDPTKLAGAYIQTISADQVWNRASPIRGQGIGVAVVDSGVNLQQDLYTTSTGKNRIVASVAYNAGWNTSINDAYGHGNHVAGIIAGNGSRSNGRYVGVAPEANIINVKVSDDTNQGVATTSSMVAGLQWIYDNRATYNIRVVNISLIDSVVESYHVSALDAAVELLWFNKIVVVTAAGNTGNSAIAAPANDPFVITVGASDDRGTPASADDKVAAWSSCGTTIDQFSKPDLVAPGVNLVAPLPVPNSFLAVKYPGNVIAGTSGESYFRMSGTSVAAPVVSGVVALLLQAQPNLTPDQVKYRLMATTRSLTSPKCSGAGLVNIQQAIDSTTTQSANTGIVISRMLNDGSNPTVWNSATWSTAKWSTAKWSTAKWSTAKWSTMTP